jgi:hypothetical protein
VNTRIADSERNRPAHLAVDAGLDGDPSAMRDVLQQMLETGMATSEVAEKVFDAIREERFWVLTHDDADDMWVQAVERRLHSLQERSNPVMNFLA